MQLCFFPKILKKPSCCRPDMVRGSTVYCRIDVQGQCRLLYRRVKGQVVIFRHVLKYLFIRLKCASRIVRNLLNQAGQKSAKFAKGRKSGKYI